MAPEMQRLLAEHVELLRLSRFMTDIVAAPGPPPSTELVSARTLLSDTLVRHLKCEDWALYPRLKSSGDPALGQLAQRFIDETGHVADAFAAYDAKWTPERIDAHWDQFRGETGAILDALATRIALEDRDLYPVVEALDSPPHAATGLVNDRGWSVVSQFEF